MIIFFNGFLKFSNGAGMGLFFAQTLFVSFSPISLGAAEVPQQKFYTEREIRKLAKDQVKRTNPNDACMISLAGLCGCDKLELSLLNIEDLITEKGKINTKVVIPKRITGKSLNRYFTVGKSGFVFDCLTEHLSWRLENKIGTLGNSGIFAGLSPESRLFWKWDRKKGSHVEFATRVNKNNCVEPYTATNYFNRINDAEGISIKVLNDSFIVNTWNLLRKKGMSVSDILESIRVMTGVSVSTIYNKAILYDLDIQKVVKGMYSRVRQDNV